MDPSTMTVTTSISVVFLDDDNLVRRALRELLKEPGIDIVAECRTSAECVEAVKRLRPHVALVDLVLHNQPLGGLDVIRQIRLVCPETVCAVITAMAEDGEYLLQSLLAGADGYYSKQYAEESLVTLVRRLAAHDYAVDPRYAQRLARFVRDQGKSRHVLGEALDFKRRHQQKERSLSSREREVLSLIADGHKPAEIAKQLFIEESTVKTHKKKIAVKLGLTSQTYVVVYAVLARYLFDPSDVESGATTVNPPRGDAKAPD